MTESEYQEMLEEVNDEFDKPYCRMIKFEDGKMITTFEYYDITHESFKKKQEEGWKAGPIQTLSEIYNKTM